MFQEGQEGKEEGKEEENQEENQEEKNQEENQEQSCKINQESDKPNSLVKKTTDDISNLLTLYLENH